MVDFEADHVAERGVQVDDWDWAHAPHIGDEAQVLYDPQDDTVVRDARLGSDTFGVVWWGLFAALFALVGVAGLRGRLPAWVLRR